jgi:hypothetical protein
VSYIVRQNLVNVDNVRTAKLIGGTGIVLCALLDTTPYSRVFTAVTDSAIVRGVVVQRDTEGSVRALNCVIISQVMAYSPLFSADQARSEC